MKEFEGEMVIDGHKCEWADPIDCVIIDPSALPHVVHCITSEFTVLHMSNNPVVNGAYKFHEAKDGTLIFKRMAE